MPQKRNPVALEHARAIGSKALGQAAAIMLAVHNTPFGDIVDTEDDLQPLVSAMFKDAARALRLVAAAMASAEFDTARMAEGASRGWITITELADTLTRERGLPFKTAHAIASKLVASASAQPGVSLAAALRDVSQAVLGQPIDYDDNALMQILSPQHFVRVRTTHGGPAPTETARAIAASRRALDSDAAWTADALARLRAAEQRAHAAVESLIPDQG
jgi:argininosuccinate lyase